MNDDCGCNAGAAGSLLALGAYLAARVLWPLLVGRPSGATWIGVVVAVIVGGATGKIVGMVRTRRAHGD
jgi:hypothetical protein